MGDPPRAIAHPLANPGLADGQRFRAEPLAQQSQAFGLFPNMSAGCIVEFDLKRVSRLTQLGQTLRSCFDGPVNR